MIALAPAILGVSLAAGLWPFGGREPEPAVTLDSLDAPTLELETKLDDTPDRRQAMDGYRRFLELDGGPAPLRLEAMRRLADLGLETGLAMELDAPEPGAGHHDLEAASRLYATLIASADVTEGRDELLYQLSRALEALGRADEATAMLERMVAEHPGAARGDEARFRLGESRFVQGDYARAERDYAAVVAAGADSAFYEQALYKRGWALFKLNLYEESLEPFHGLLELRAESSPAIAEGQLEALGRAERELLDDTLRAMSLAFTWMDGPDSLTAFESSRGYRSWTWLLYRSLGDLYLEKERFRDAAAGYAAFVERHPVHDQAPRLQEAVIEAHSRGGFASLVLDAKRDYVQHYAPGAPYWNGRETAGEPAAAVLGGLKRHLGDLAAHDHSLAQASGSPADYERAAGWYRQYLDHFPDDPDSAGRSFLLGELYYEAARFDEARLAYLRSAYDYGSHDRAAEAGYAALLAAREHERSLEGEQLAQWRAEDIEHSLHFAESFPGHPQSAAVLTTVAERLYAVGNPQRAIAVALDVAARMPPAGPELERVAWTVVAHGRFDLGEHAAAEEAYARLTAFDLSAEDRAQVESRQAASIFMQAEAAEQGGDIDGAVTHFLRIARVVPGSDIRPQAEFDAATLLLGADRHAEAAALLRAFRANFPDHGFNDDVTAKLALALKEDGQPASAALEYERLAEVPGTDEATRAALWQAAELWAAAARPDNEARVYDRLVQVYPHPFGEALEARHRLATLAAASGNWPERRRRLEALVEADAAAGKDRSARSRYLAAHASLELARPLRDDFNLSRLTPPLDRSLRTKRERMERALAAYAAVAAYGVAETATAAAFETADLYYRLSRDLLESTRPDGLSPEELEQYELLLEEQAFPFEEQAIALYEANAARAADGVWDEWVRVSFARLGALVPARWDRRELRDPDAAGQATPALRLARERVDSGDDAAFAQRMGEALAACEPCAPAWSELGLVHRLEGRFGQAESAYRAALEIDPDYPIAHYNLAVLHELYTARPELALDGYRRYLELAPGIDAGHDARVGAWVADLERRLSTSARTARSD